MIGGIVAAGIILALVLFLLPQGGKSVQIRVSGEVVQTLPLDRNVRFEITGASGGRNLLCIENGSAWVEEADCPDGLCKNMGKINRTGQSVVCLPHQVVIEIIDETGNDNDREPDVIVQ